MICHGNGSAYHTCPNNDVKRFRREGGNGEGTIYHLCPRALAEWNQDAISFKEPHLKLVEVPA